MKKLALLLFIFLGAHGKIHKKQWLEAIAKQMKATTIVDNKALDEGAFMNQLG